MTFVLPSVLRCSRLFTGLVLCAILSPGAGAARGPESLDAEVPVPVPGFEEEVRVELVLIEAVVVDRAGRHVRGLTADEFRVREAGREMPIVSFDEIDLVGRQERPAAAGPDAPETKDRPASEAASAQPEQDPAPATPAVARERTVVLLFDGYNNASALSLSQARRAAKKFLRSRLLPGDRAAIYEISPFLRSLTSFVTDVEVLEKGIDEVRYYPGTSLGKDITDAAVYQGRLGSRSDIERRLLASGTFAASQYAAERRQYIRSLSSLADVLEQLPGRKLVALFSGGFPMVLAQEDRASVGFGEDFRRMVRQFQKSRTTVYSMNIGEEPALVDATVDSSYRDTLDYLGLGPDYVDYLGVGLGPGGDSSVAYNQFQSVLALESGGRFFPGRDYLAALNGVDDDSRHYYLIGYEWDPTVAQGRKRDRYRRIKIDVQGKKLRAVARSGRFVRDERTRQPTEQGSAVGVAAVAVPAPEPPRHDLSCAPVLFPLERDRTLVVLPLRLSGPVTSVHTPEGDLLDISTRTVARMGQNEFANPSHDFRSRLKPGVSADLGRGLQLTEAIELASGRYEVDAWLRLNGRDIEARWMGTIEVPSWGMDDLEVGGLTVLAEESAPPIVADVFTALESGAVTDERAWSDPFKLQGDWRVMGRGQPVVRVGEAPTIFFRVYNPEVQPDSGLPVDLALDYSLRPMPDGREILPPIELVYFRRARQAGAFDVVVRLDLGTVEPGSYRLRVDAREEHDGAQAARETAIRVASEFEEDPGPQ
jgi:VWFA-related protein